ncbi:hypothetical protein Bbelb_395060 [Branchiostoma belcheri]|nr:hypothetical protein Bbelb_395060 [Branchiostoma belcheri]
MQANGLGTCPRHTKEDTGISAVTKRAGTTRHLSSGKTAANHSAEPPSRHDQDVRPWAYMSQDVGRSLPTAPASAPSSGPSAPSLAAWQYTGQDQTDSYMCDRGSANEQ